MGTRASGDLDLDRQVWAATQKEVHEGLLQGPITAAEASAKHGPLWIPARRFGLRQSGKVRPIDDFSEMGHNDTVGTSCKVDLGGVDEVVGVARALFNAVSSVGPQTVVDEEGHQHSFEAHPDWHGRNPELVGFCADLEGAFRQVPRLPAHGAFSLVSIWDPDRQRALLFELVALAFGQKGAVWAFNRVSRALDAIFAALGCVCAKYVDDYPAIAPREIADETVQSLRACCSLLGWRLKKADVLLPSSGFKALGIHVRLPASIADPIFVEHWPERKAKDLSEVRSILSEGRCSPARMRQLRGRLAFLACQSFGRCGGFAARLLTPLAESSGGARPLTPTEVIGLRSWVSLIQIGRPRKVHTASGGQPVVLVTDGAVESTVTVGAVLFDAAAGRLEFAGGEVPQPVAEMWGRRVGVEQVIGQAEIAPVALSLLLWPEVLRGRRVLIFVDNLSALGALVRGTSPSLASARLASMFWRLAAELEVEVWFDWVPGPANLADAPSRLEFGVLRELGGAQRVFGPEDWQALKEGGV